MTKETVIPMVALNRPDLRTAASRPPKTGVDSTAPSLAASPTIRSVKEI